MEIEPSTSRTDEYDLSDNSLLNHAPRKPPSANDHSITKYHRHVLLGVLLFILFTVYLFLTPTITHLSNVRLPSVDTPGHLTVVTLIYGQAYSHRIIAHNCRRISETRHHFIVYTDDPSQSYCALCECRHFVKEDCACAEQGPNGCALVNLCEKLFFFVRVVRELREIVLLDDDLIIMKDYFLDRLQARSTAHDFLASYGHTSVNSEPFVLGKNVLDALQLDNATRESLNLYKHGPGYSNRYKRNFNTGLVFIRWLPHIDYDEMKRNMYRKQVSGDQGVVSDFVQKHYENWDVLSWKWHCRGLRSLKQDIPPFDCYTIHDRNEASALLTELNVSLLKVP